MKILDFKKWSNIVGWGAYVCVIFVFISAFVLPRTEILIVKVFGLCFLGISLPLAFYPFFYLKKRGEVEKGKPYFDTCTVVDSGIYKLVRHPQYLGYSLLIIGFAFINFNLMSVVFALIGSIFLYVQGSMEEKLLIDKFGAEYQKYMEQTPRFNIVVGFFRLMK